LKDGCLSNPLIRTHADLQASASPQSLLPLIYLHRTYTSNPAQDPLDKNIGKNKSFAQSFRLNRKATSVYP
jgi:hypothetical protein